MGHPDFRVRNRIFASLNAEHTTGTVKVSPDEQARLIEADATVFVPASGAWGRQGWTTVHLAAAPSELVGEALTLAWQLMQKTAKAPTASPRASRTTARSSRTSTTPASRKGGPAAASGAAKASGRAATKGRARAAATAANDAVSVIDHYIAACEPKVRTVMNTVRALVRKVAPAATEKFSYRMPAFEQEGMLLYYAPFKNHLGIYPPVKGDAALAKALAPYRGEKGNLRFPFDKPMPYPLIRRVVRARLAEHLEQRAARRAGKRPASNTVRAGTARRAKR